jgi:putative ABC transport system ATP-binding protein
MDKASSAPTARPVPECVLRINGLTHRWPAASQLTLQINRLELAPGERLLVRGNSGSGKSTLLSMAAGVMLPSEGDVSLQGVGWRGLAPKQRDRLRADHIGYIFQQFNLLPYLNALDNVLLACRFSARRTERAGDPLQAARHLLQALDLPPATWQLDAARLSVGQQQRVAAARALIGRPELVIADEPTSALDEARRDAFMQLLLTQCAAAGSALLFVTHDARLAHHFDRVLELPGSPA